MQKVTWLRLSQRQKMGLRRTLHTFGQAPPAPSRLSVVQGLPPTIHWQGYTEGPKRHPASQVQATAAAWEIRKRRLPAVRASSSTTHGGTGSLQEVHGPTGPSDRTASRTPADDPRSGAQPTWRQGRRYPRSPAHYAQVNAGNEGGTRNSKFALAPN